MTTTVHLTMQSKNQKTGPIPVSVTSADTCPTSCPMQSPDKGALRCYAKKGPMLLHWSKVTSGERGMPWGEFCASIAALPAGTLWRHNSAGDLPGEGDTINEPQLLGLAEANRGRKGFTYTHKPVGLNNERDMGNLFAIAGAVRRGFAINLSANDLDHADRLSGAVGSLFAEDRPHVVCIVPKDHPERSTTPAGRPVVVCPEQTGKARNCLECGLCARMDRTPIVAFREH